MTPSREERYRRIYAAVATLAAGEVASYAEVARRAGLPGRAREVGRALAAGPDDLPWHRVVNAAGRISLPAGSAAAIEQERRLRAEGVAVHAGRVARRHRVAASATLDALLWGPPGSGEETVS
jgi:methylated-DNA-protein-cysteine methyltransferase-like protein